MIFWNLFTHKPRLINYKKLAPMFKEVCKIHAYSYTVLLENCLLGVRDQHLYKLYSTSWHWWSTYRMAMNGTFYFTKIPWHLNHTRMFEVDQVKVIFTKNLFDDSWRIWYNFYGWWTQIVMFECRDMSYVTNSKELWKYICYSVFIHIILHYNSRDWLLTLP